MILTESDGDRDIDTVGEDEDIDTFGDDADEVLTTETCGLAT